MGKGRTMNKKALNFLKGRQSNWPYKVIPIWHLEEFDKVTAIM